MASQQHLHAVDRLVEHERMRDASADRQALLVAQARLLDIDIDVLDRTHDPRCLVLHPAGVRVGDQAVAGFQLGRDRPDPLDVDIRITADLQLEPAVTLGPVSGHARGHRVGILLRDGPVQHEIIAVPAPEQIADRATRDLAQDVPAGDVDARLDVGMSLEGP